MNILSISVPISRVCQINEHEDQLVNKGHKDQLVKVLNYLAAK